MRTAVYLRISQDRTGLALGIERQLEDCVSTARQRGWAVSATFSDNDLSATKGKRRPGYADLMAAVERGEIDKIIVYMTSRLWRNRRERAAGMELLQAHQVAVVPVRGPELDFSSANGRMVADILGALDTAEVEIKSERAKREIIQRAMRGAPLGGPKMFGVAADGRTLVEEEAGQIRDWYNLVVAGGTLASMARSSGKHHSSVLKILRNPRNAGLRILDGVTYGASNPAIVPETTWRAVQGILDDPKRRHSPTNAHRWFGAGFYRCVECDRPVTTRYTTGTPGALVRSYACERLTGGCGRFWRADRIDKFVSGVMAGWLAKYGNQLPRRDASPAGDLASEAAGLRVRLKQAEREFAEDDDADIPEFREAIRRMRTRLADVEARMEVAGHASALDALLAMDDPVAAWLALREAPRQRAIVAALMTIDLLPSKLGRPPKNWDPESVVRVGWRDLNAES